MTAPAIWRSRPVFITSTFRDMHAERDWLRSHVFPELEDRLRARFHHLETIDLRWGVDSASKAREDEREMAVLTVCLDEIRRSRPFLIGLLGDRYGWRPPAARITGAAREAGLADDVAGKSVTELEILYGVLRNPDQQQRSWVYVREPLPYDTMAPPIAARYSDAHSGEPDATEKVQKLKALKEQLLTALPGRVRHYRARWDVDRQSAREDDLKAWGVQVVEDLWSDLEAETAAFLRDAPKTWQEHDRWALDEFVEGRVRGFVGRTGITNELIELATSPAAEGAPWGACVTAEAGGGKSSLFGHLYRTLRQKDVVVLAHAAGISVRSTHVDRMLRRWVGELATVTSEADPLAESSTPDEIDLAFSRLLHQVSHSMRVVVLLDALNQFEATTRATHLTWLSRLWPSNARLVATAIPGVQSESLLKRVGTISKPLPAIDQNEAVAIVRGICARYHRSLNPAVENAVLAKRNAADALALGNPLWLEIATEELNLLDASAFDRGEADTSGDVTDAERIVRLLLSTVDRMPGDVEGLYGFMFDRAERQFGQAWTRAFVNLIGVSRAGWRELDLEALMPVLSGEAWDPLRFATLRRGFRAHVVQRGAHAQWDFAHAQMRQAIFRRLMQDNIDQAPLHAAISRHLLGLRHDDPLHESEAMVHLMQTGDLRQAAAFYGGDLTVGEATGATAALQERVLEGEVAAVVALMEQSVAIPRRGRVGERVLFDLDEALENMVPLDVRGQLHQAAKRTFDDLVLADPENARWQHDLSVSHNKIGDVLTAQGNLPDALAAFHVSLAIAEQLAAADPGNANRQRDLSVGHNKLGDVLMTQGNLAGALAAFQAGVAIRDRLAVADPSNSGWQHDLSVSHRNLGDVLTLEGKLPGALAAFQASLAIARRLAALDPGNAGWQRDQLTSHNELGNVLRAQGNLAGALAAFQASLAIAERLAAADPGNADWQRNLSVSHERLGDVLRAQGNLPGALASFQASLAIRERLAAADVGNARWQHDLARIHIELGDVLRAQGNQAGAHAWFQASLAILKRLAVADPGNAYWQHDLAISHSKLGEMLTAQGNLPGGLAAFQATHGILERLAAVDPGNASWQRDLSVSHNKLGDVLAAQGNLSDALAAFQATHRILERLAAADHSNAGWQHDLSVSHRDLGDVLAAQGNLPDALAAFQAGLAIAERLAAADPGNAGWQRDLSVSSNKIGDVLTAQGNLPGALASFRASLGIRERLTAADPGNAEWQRDLSVSHIKLGDVLTVQGNLPGALAAFQAGLAIAERLAAADPGNADWQRDLSVRHERLGDVLRAQENLPGALAACQASLAIAERLAALDSGNAGWQRDLSVSHERLGDVLKAQGNLAGAATAFQAGLAIRERQAAATPGNAGWQRDVSVSHIKMGDLLRVQGNLPGALAAFQSGLAIAERLAAADPGNADWQRDLVVSHVKLALLLNSTDPLAARQQFEACHDVLRRMRAQGMFLDPPLVRLLEQFESGSAN